jgi:hypothetical protein
MKQNILYVDLDVDDTQYHGLAFNKDPVKPLTSNAGPP